MSRALPFFILGGLVLAVGCNKGSPKPQPTNKTEPPAMGPTVAGMRRPGKRAADGKRTAPRPKGGLSMVKLWTTGGVDVPESVYYDAARQVLYVSCINGKPTEKNGQGYIARVSLVGKLLQQKWVTGLDAPKGMGLQGDTLLVTDITRLHAIDVKTGKIKQTIDAPGAKFLNDIAVGPQGEVYVSDMVTAAIHVLRKGKLATLVNLKQFKGSNGMLMQGGALLVGTATGIVKVTPADAKATLLVPVKDFGMIDGLRADGTSGYLVSNWKGRTQYVSRAGEVTVLADTTAQKIQSADLEYVADKRMLIIPTFFHNKVVAYRLR